MLGMFGVDNVEAIKSEEIIDIEDIPNDMEQPALLLGDAADKSFSDAVFDEHSISGNKEMLDVEKYITNKQGYRFMRRSQDILFSALAIILLIIPCIFVALIIFFDDPKGSPIFTQDRIGLNGKKFKFFKFRSMCVDAESKLKELKEKNEKDGPVFKIKNDPRITRVGKFIRKTSIDELPQLLNVLMGDMSIVGPRPALPNEVEQYDEYQKQRILVRPGLTCYWQIQHHRDNITFDQWMDMDIKYIKERSFLVDWKIILKTVLAVFRGSGT